MERREQLGRGLEVLDQLTEIILALDLAATPAMVRKERISFWRDSFLRELAQIEERLKLEGVGRFKEWEN